MFCQNCGSENFRSARFCRNCGVELYNSANIMENESNKPNKNMEGTIKTGKTTKRLLEFKKSHIFMAVSLVFIILIGLFFSLSSSKEVPQDMIVSYIAEEALDWKMEGYKISKIKHNYDSKESIDTVIVDIIVENTYADTYKTYEIKYNYNSSVGIWTTKNEKSYNTEIKWKKSMYKTWSGLKDGNNYSVEIHSIEGNDPDNMKVECSYRVEGPNCFVIGTRETYFATYNDNGVMIIKEDSKGVEHYITFRISTRSGVVMDLIV